MKEVVLLILFVLCTISSVGAAKGWFIQQFYDFVNDDTCSNQYIRTTAYKLDTCIVRGHTSTKYTANKDGHTDFQICIDNVCGNCTTYTLVSSTCRSSSSGELETMYNVADFPDHLLPKYYVLSVTYTWGTDECLGDAEVLYITPGEECVEACDTDEQQFCSEFPAHLIDGVPKPTVKPPITPPKVSGPWFVAEYYKEDSCSQFAFAHLFEINMCMSPPNSPISSVYRIASDGIVHGYQCHDTVCGNCTDHGVPPGYKGCAREDAHDLPARREAVRGLPEYTGSLLTKRDDDDPANYDYFYLDSYVSTVFPTEFEADSTVVVYYQGYVDDNHACGGLVDHIIVTPHSSKCEEICAYGLQFFCEMPQFLNASGVVPPTLPPSPHHEDKGHPGRTVAIALVVIVVVAAAAIGAFLFVKRQQLLGGGKLVIGRYSLLNANKEAADDDEILEA